MAAAFVALLTIVFAVQMLQTPRYSAAATIMISPGADRIVSRGEPDSGGGTSSAAIDSEVEVLRSVGFAKRVVQRMHLTADPSWYGGRASTRQEEIDPAARRLASMVEISRRSLSNVIDIQVSAANPDAAARIANGYVDAYVDLLLETQSATEQQASRWLQQRTSALQRELAQKEAAVARYRAQTGLVVQQGDSLSEQRVRDVQGQVLTARADLAERQARSAQIQRQVTRGGDVEAMGAALDSAVVQSLRSEEAQATQQQAQLEAELGPLHPNVINGRNRIDDIRRQIRAEISRIVVGASNDVEIARSRVYALESSLNSVSGQAATSNSDGVRLQELMLDAASARAVYESFLQRYNEISGQGSISGIQVRKVNEATPPTSPSSPELAKSLLIALAAAVGGALAALLIMEVFSNVLVRVEDITAMTGVPALVSIPLVTKPQIRSLAFNERHPSGYLVDKPMSAYAEAFRLLRTLLNAQKAGRMQIVAVTSALPDEGKTTCAFSLARSAAMVGQRVIIIDCDLRRCSINKLLEIAPSLGIAQVISGESRLADVIKRDESTTAHILPAAPAAFNNQEIFGTPEMARLLELLRENYDLVVLDSPPVLAIAESRVIASLADATILVARWRKSPMPAIRDAVTQLDAAGANLIGVASNCVEASAGAAAGYYSQAAHSFS